MPDINVKINVKVQGLKKLADYMASSIGAFTGPLMAPWKARKKVQARLIEAKTEADSIKMVAEAQAESHRLLDAHAESEQKIQEISPEFVRERIEFQEQKRLANIRDVVQNTAAELDGKDVPEHEPDPDWTARFFNCVQDVSSEEMRKLWAKLLSGEVENPGRTSLRTLTVLKDMSQKDAKLFRDVCNYVIGDFVFYPEECADHPVLNLNNMMHLQAIGLIYIERLLVKSFSVSKEPAYFLCCDTVLSITTNGEPKKIDVEAAILTNSGRELCRITDITESTVCKDYLRSFSKSLRQQNCELSSAPIKEKYPDDKFKVAHPFVPVEPEPE